MPRQARLDAPGTLLQNRYKSIICEEDPYFLVAPIYDTP